VRRGGLRRRLSAGGRLVAALALAGGLYTGFTPGPSPAEDQPNFTAEAVEGKRLYDDTCITCHGENGQGQEGRGPSLIGVGSAAVEFQVATGRMPAPRSHEAQIDRKLPVYSREQAQRIGLYIQQLGGGPTLPAGNDLGKDGDIVRGGELYRINCMSCHAASANGGALSSGKYAPTLEPATERDIYAAMLTGPQNMPVFGDNQLTPEQKRDVIAYVQHLKTDPDAGGFGLGRYGPVTEGMVIFGIGMVALVFATLWIAGKS
jgi:ubiquinol-cytochrome c reductase cytochrome c subunit